MSKPQHLNRTKAQKQKKPVSIAWQCVATFWLPTGLYAFKRIDKLWSGIAIFVLSFAVAVITATMSVLMFDSEALSILWLCSTYVVMIGLPIYFIWKLSKDYNQKLDKFSA